MMAEEVLVTPHIKRSSINLGGKKLGGMFCKSRAIGNLQNREWPRTAATATENQKWWHDLIHEQGSKKSLLLQSQTEQ